MFCSNCGKEVNENAVICTQCGCYVNGNTNIRGKAIANKSNKAVDLTMIIGFAVSCFLMLLLVILGVEYSTLYILQFVFAILFTGAMTVAFVLSFKAEKKYSKVISSLLFIYAIYMLLVNMIFMIQVL